MIRSIIKRITIMNKKPKLGRPSLPKDDVKQVFPIRLSRFERHVVEKAARKAGLRASEWARSVMLASAANA